MKIPIPAEVTEMMNAAATSMDDMNCKLDQVIALLTVLVEQTRTPQYSKAPM